jgi:hypothetical protein
VGSRMYIKLGRGVVYLCYTRSSLFLSFLVNLKLTPARVLLLHRTFYSASPLQEENSTMSFFKKLKSEFEEMFGDDDKKKEEKPLQPVQDSKPIESSEFSVLPPTQTYND